MTIKGSVRKNNPDFVVNIFTLIGHSKRFAYNLASTFFTLCKSSGIPKNFELRPELLSSNNFYLLAVKH